MNNKTQYQKEYYKKNRLKINAYLKEWKRQHYVHHPLPPATIKDDCGNIIRRCFICKKQKPIQEYVQDLTLSYGKSHKCKECHRNNTRKYYKNNREKMIAHSKNYESNNKTKMQLYRKTYCRKKLENDIYFRIRKNLRTRLRDAIQRNAKSASTLKLLGCTIDYLKQYLQSKFQSSMTWENYGKWHIDHKIPCAAFDLTDPNQQAICFNWRNLQPLWAKDNISKRNKLY